MAYSLLAILQTKITHFLLILRFYIGVFILTVEAQPSFNYEITHMEAVLVKEPFLSAPIVVFSVERLIRVCSEVVYGRRAAVFGLGAVLQLAQ